MYAVVRVGGKQYTVKEGDSILVEKIEAEPGKTVLLKEVLFLGDENEKIVGTPLIEGAKVEARVVDQTRGEKIIVFKYKRRKGYKKKIGHRQYLTKLEILKIGRE